MNKRALAMVIRDSVADLDMTIEGIYLRDEDWVKVADSVLVHLKLPADPPLTFPCGHPRDAQTTRHTCASGDYHIPPHEHEWADLHGVIGCGICRLAKEQS